jgi:upstream activation factor subunit UAF30
MDPQEVKDNVVDIFEQFETIMDNISQFKNHINNLQIQVKSLEKNVKKQMKNLNKEVSKSKMKGNRKPSGFAKPTKVTKELCVFMNKKEGTEIARTEVTKSLIDYIKTNELQNKTNSKIILPDEKLKFLLGIEDNNELTFFNIQKYMNKHFITSNSDNM